MQKETERLHMEIPEDRYLCPVFTKEGVDEHGKPIMVLRMVATSEHIESELTGSFKDIVMALSFAMQKDEDFFNAVSMAKAIVENSPHRKVIEKIQGAIESMGFKKV